MNITKVREELNKGKTIYDMKLRVADLCRVSTDKNEQLNSLDNQINYFNDMIKSCQNWTHVASYVDEGKSGTSVKKRLNFLKMIDDAKKGKIDLILTKEVSRFARNTIDSIHYTQVLLKYGVIVFFLSDNINTIYPDSEFRLTLMASMAQDEVRKLSERVKFGIKRMIKDGKLIGGGNITGYNKKNGKLTINEHEKPIVETLFNLYVTGEYGFTKIGYILAQMGYFTKKGKIYSDITLKKMLQNPRYKGYYTANISRVDDYLTHKKIINSKEQWICYKDEKIPPIINEEIWNKANQIYKEKQSHQHKTIINRTLYLEKKTYTLKLVCATHHTTFIKSSSKKRINNPVWCCSKYIKYGLKGCRTPIIKEEHLNKVLITVLEKHMVNLNRYIKDIILDYERIIKDINKKRTIIKLKEQLKEQLNIKTRLFEMSLKNLITDDEFLIKKKHIDREIININNQINDKKSHEKNIENIYRIKEFIIKQTDLNKNIIKYVNLLIDKILISKIIENRKHIKLEIIYNFNIENEIIEMIL